MLANHQKMIAASKESGQLEPVVSRYREYLKTRDAAEELRALAANKADADMAELAASELPGTEAPLRWSWSSR